MSNVLRHTLAAALLVVAAACADRGDDVGGFYVLRTMGDSQPPFVEYNSGGWVTTLLADTLAINGRGTAIETSVVRVQGPTGQPTTGAGIRRGDYRVRRDTVDIAWVCNYFDRVASAPRLSTVPAWGEARSPTDPPRRDGIGVCVWPVYLRSGSGLTMVARDPQLPIVSRFYQRVQPFPLVP